MLTRRSLVGGSLAALAMPVLEAEAQSWPFPHHFPKPPRLPKVYCKDQRNSVSSGKDNGANNNDARLMWKSRRHGTTEQMLRNVAGTRGRINISGHGTDGYVETGIGQKGSHPDKEIAYWNDYAWEPLLERHLPRLDYKPADRDRTMVSIYSCYTGAGQSGAYLLWRLAQATGRAFRARTGLMSSNRFEISFQQRSTWQLATPDMLRPPPPIARPRRGHRQPLLPSFLKAEDPRWGDIKAVAIEALLDGKIVRREFSAETGRELGALLLYDRFKGEVGEIPGIVTVEASFVFASFPPLTATVLCDDVTLIRETGEQAYASPDLRDFLVRIFT